MRYIQTAMTDPIPGLPLYVLVGNMDGDIFCTTTAPRRERPQSNVVPIVVGVVVAIVVIAIMAGVGFVIDKCYAGKKEKGYYVAPNRYV